MDMHEIAEVVAGRPATARVRFRQGTVAAVAADGTLSVKIAGSDVTLTGIRALASVCPIIGAGVWLASDGLDLFAIGTMAPTGPAFCSLTRTVDGNLATGQWYDLSFGTSDRDDPYGMWDATAADRVTCIAPGVYHLFGAVTYDNNSTGRRDVRIGVNGAAVTYDGRLPVTGVNTSCTVSTLYELAAGDYVQLGARQSSGGTLAVIASSGGIRLTACWLRPVSS